MYAKLKDPNHNHDQIWSTTILGHLQDVSSVSRTLLSEIGGLLISNSGLKGDIWLKRFNEALFLAAKIHDIGKANSHFQEAIKNTGKRQAIRHEAISALFCLEEFFFKKEFDSYCEKYKICENTKKSILLAVLSHHVKFNNNNRKPGSSTNFSELEKNLKEIKFIIGAEFKPISLFVFESYSKEGKAFKSFSVDEIIDVGAPNKTPFLGIKNKSFKNLIDFSLSLNDHSKKDWRTFVELLQGVMITCDVLGSALPFSTREGANMHDWIRNSLGAGIHEADCDKILASRLGTGYKLRDFQIDAKEKSKRITLISAGCGSGKTIAAYNWAKRWCNGRKLYFTYPTTGLATEGFRDYLEIDGIKSKLVHSRVLADDILISPRESEKKNKEDEQEFLKKSIGCLELVGTQVVSCTIDTVLNGLNLSGTYRSVYAALLSGAFILDEIHAYDDVMFEHTINILQTFSGIPALLMTATLSQERIKKLQSIFGSEFEILGGPPEQDVNEKYKISIMKNAVANKEPITESSEVLEKIKEQVENNGRILVVANTVTTAMNTWKHLKDKFSNVATVKIYHSRFKYKDRVKIHKESISAFQEAKKKNKPVILVATQVAEMSLDLDATLLVSSIAPVDAITQRMGRLNRSINTNSVCECLIVPVSGQVYPYQSPEGKEGSRGWEDIEIAKTWVSELEKLPKFSQGTMNDLFVQLQSTRKPERRNSLIRKNHLFLEPVPSRQSGMESANIIDFKDRSVLIDKFGNIKKVEKILNSIPTPVGKKLRAKLENETLFEYDARSRVYISKIPLPYSSEYGLRLDEVTG